MTDLRDWYVPQGWTLDAMVGVARRAVANHPHLAIVHAHSVRLPCNGECVRVEPEPVEAEA